MSKLSKLAAKKRRQRSRRFTRPRSDDPRVVRSRAAVVEAARELFLRKGYAGTTMEEIAALAGITKRTVYNNYPDKNALFSQIVTDVIGYAEEFARSVREEFAVGITAATVRATLEVLGRRLALRIIDPEVISLRRLLIGEAREFPALAAEYFDRAPGQVLKELASGFDRLGQIGVLKKSNARQAASQFAYLVVGEPLDRAVLVGTNPNREHVIASAREGVETFLARYGVAGNNRGRKRIRSERPQ